MIVTRTYLEEYLDLDGISNEEIVAKLNSIGLEVDGTKKYEIPSKVVIGEIVSCQKHPNADKLNLCEVNIGSELVQIICGAANVVNAKYVAVATIGAVLPPVKEDDKELKIKKAKLRGVESYGMICSSTELGLPELEDGIMILDDSIGELVVGKELKEYKKVADFVIDVDITANRGDALSIYGIARDLAVAFKRELKQKEFKSCNKSDGEFSLTLKNSCKFPGLIEYELIKASGVKPRFLDRLRAAFCELEYKNDLDMLLSLALHESGVLLRAYDAKKIAKDNKIELEAVCKDYMVEILANNGKISTLGVNANEELLAEGDGEILLEASYIEPEFVVEGVSSNKLKSDKLYYNSSRGSEADIDFGLRVLKNFISSDSKECESQAKLKVENELEKKVIETSIDELNDIIGNSLNKEDILDTLKRLNYEISEDDNRLTLIVPRAFHDVKNPSDVAEEIVRFYGIDNIEPKPLLVEEKSRITDAYLTFREKEALVNRAIAAGFNEALTYAFSDKEKLIKYGFEVLKDELDLINPIVKELSTLRSTMFINLLEAVSKNVKYGKKSIALFEIGSVFNSDRKEKQKVSFIFSGELERASVKNSAKAKKIDFASFVDKIGSVIGEFKLIKCEPKNALMHPYQSADILKDGEVVGFVSKVHPQVLKDYDIDESFICELDLEKILPKHKVAKELSNYQPVNKDLSVVVDENLSFYDVAKELKSFRASQELLKDFYPLDIYQDDELKSKGKKSLTIRFTLQSDEKTLSDEEIKQVIESEVLELLKDKFNAELR